MSVDLVFQLPPIDGSPTDLVFGELVPVSLVISGELPEIGGAVILDSGSVPFVIDGALPDLDGVVSFEVSVSMPDLIGYSAGAPWREGQRTPNPHGLPWPSSEGLHVLHAIPWREGARLELDFDLPWVDTTPLRGKPIGMPWKSGIDVNQFWAMPWHDMIPVHADPVGLPWRDGIHTVEDWALPWREGTPTDRYWGLPWREALRLQLLFELAFQRGDANSRGTGLPWQDGIVVESHGGPQIEPPPPPPPVPCYIPSPDLVFKEVRLGKNLLELVFVCETTPDAPGATIVVPIRRIYTVFNSFILRRVDTDHPLPATSFGMSIDWNSWTWGFSAQIPRIEYDAICPDVDGTPVELEATINGVSYRFLIDSIEADRTFGTVKMLKVSGRGIGAALDLLSGSYDNSAGVITANQIMEEILTVNGVGVGWDIEFGLEDWTVPEGAWAFSGTAIDALKAVAGAAGGYLQPHPTDKTLIVMSKYPEAPWNWGLLTPDYEIPSAVATKDANYWKEKPRYNRVNVIAQSQGIHGVVTREGTDGALVAPTVIDALISDDIPARQRGRVVLSDTGRENRVALTLPILALTGIIPPGKLVRYVDGATTVLGYVRSTSVTVAKDKSRQTIEIECHE